MSVLKLSDIKHILFELIIYIMIFRRRTAAKREDRRRFKDGR